MLHPVTGNLIERTTMSYNEADVGAMRRAHSTPDPDLPPPEPKAPPVPEDVPPPVHAPVEEPAPPVPPIRAG